MKRFTIIMALVLSMAGFTYAQNSALNKITPELQEELDKRPSADEMFRIIIVMADEYDQNQMSRQIQFLGKTERRAYVIEELQRFSKASQYDLMQLLDEGAKANTVTDINPFWIFNGISCITNREMIATLSDRKDIVVIESDKVRNMLPENEKPVELKEQLPGLAWHVSQVHANDVWNLGYNGSGVVVAIIDTGVNYNHADLADHMWNGGTQYPHHGYDFCNTIDSSTGTTTEDNDPLDQNGHGSHCAGITAGDGTSGTQTGIAPNATIMAVKVFAASGSTTSTCITSGIQFAASNGADILSLSLGGHGGGIASYRTMFENLMTAGIIASIAAGNEGENYTSSNPDTNGNYYLVPDNVGHPGNCPPPWHNPDQTLTGGLSAVVTVGASNRNDRKTTFSSFGPCTWATGSYIGSYSDYPYTEGDNINIGLIKPDIIAPGADITSCDYSNNNGYVSKKGTSMATPLVSGIMALMLNANPNLNPAQIDELLETTAIPVDYRITKNNYTGAGRADALAAIDAVLTQATKPTNLSLETFGGNVNLTWTASNAPAGYCIYRDNVQVGTTTETTYTDENVEIGKHVYYVRANDNTGRQSVHSKAVMCTINPYASTPSNITIDWDEGNASLNWEASSTNSNNVISSDLYFTTNPATASRPGQNTTVFWGIKYEPEDLRNYIGMSINQISIGIYSTSLTHTIRIYRGTSYGNTTSEPAYSQSFTPTCSIWGTQLVTLNTPYLIDDITEDLWITCSATLESTNTYPAVVGDYTGHSSNCFYLTKGNDCNNVIWKHSPDGGNHYAACIKAHLTRTTTYTPTYNVYLDNNSKANNLSVTNYTDTPSLHSGDNTYYVTAKVGNNESCPSNEAKIVVIDNSQTDNDDITIDNSLVYIINPTGTLTANGNLSSTDPTRLILQDGAQLIHNSSGVKATVHKSIDGYGSDETSSNGWNFIASPMTTLTINNPEHTNIASNDYDLYIFDQNRVLEWQNYKKNGSSDHTNFTTLDNSKGYLYAHNPSLDAVFMGELANPNGEIQLLYNTSNPNPNMHGWNLIGNPFACNAYINRSYYTLNVDGNGLQAVEDNAAISPCTGIMVKTENTSGETVTFTMEPQTSGTKGSLNITLAKVGTRDNAIIDNAIVTFNKDNELGKFYLGQSNANIYIPQNGEEYAIAYSQGMGEMPLNFIANQDGSYRLDISSLDVSFNYLHLIDNLTGKDVDLLATPTYTFEAKTSDYASRFKLVFDNSNGSSTGSETFAFISDGNLIVNNPGKASLQIVDMMGRVIIEGDAMNRVSTSEMMPGVYVVRLITEGDMRTQKIIVE